MARRLPFVLAAAAFFALCAAAFAVQGPHRWMGDWAENSCGVCHRFTMQNQLNMSTQICRKCHSETPDPEWEPATPMPVHGSAITGSAKFEYQIGCTGCHEPHGDRRIPAGALPNIQYIRNKIEDQPIANGPWVPLEITVIDNTQAVPVQITKQINSQIVFLGPADFADGDASYTEDICVTCHTLTNHHQNDGSAPGGQSHFDGESCTTCHLHEEGFAPPGGLGGAPLSGPHAMLPGYPEQTCGVCHDLYPDLQQMIANSTAVCLACHSESPTLIPATPESIHASAVSGSSRFDYAMECTACHDPHGWPSKITNILGTENIKYVKANIDELITVVDNTQSPPVTVTKQIDHDVVFDSRPDDFANGDALYSEDICNTCHTLTDHHQNDGTAPGGQSHFDGQDCTLCHTHPEGFGAGAFGGPHPQAATDCGVCHLDPASLEPDLQGLHGNDCGLCHPSGFGSTFLGPLGSWDGECRSCHNPARPETGFMDEPTKGHRCVACHGEQLSVRRFAEIHKKHAEKANCVVCHGTIPLTGTAIGSGDRTLCNICHERGKSGDVRKIHRKHVDKGLSCLECHNGMRPPVDVVDGPPVGSSRNVCRICHENRDPSEFRRALERRHEKHTDNRMDCGACHLAAQLQDDRYPMPPIDDPVRAQLDRGGFGACVHCHEDGEEAEAREAHERHVADQWQWCYNCHLPTDGRPQGAEGPVTEPRQACVLCHDSRGYRDSLPFEVHEKHAEKAKCYACHQTVPRLFDWPRAWLGGVD